MTSRIAQQANRILADGVRGVKRISPWSGRTRLQSRTSQAMRDKLLEHTQYITEQSEDLPEVRH